MKVLVLATDYPDNNGKVTLMYIHSRNRYYSEHGIDVTVLNFAATGKYVIDSIPVISLNDYQASEIEYDILIVHAANIRNHYHFLKQYGDRFKKFIFFFHGHEVLRIRETYSEPYSYIKQRGISDTFIQDIYDSYKLSIWRRYYPSIKEKSAFIFVSDWMKKQFEKYTKIDLGSFQYYVIPNNVGSIFEEKSYNKGQSKEFDFVTIRSNLDGSKYCIDVINRIAGENRELKFLVIGKGEYFSHNTKAENITWRAEGLTHKDIPEVLDSARCALMPTRLDAQGVMMCEMATYGIPVITSDIDICRELNGIFENFILISNEKSINLASYENEIECKSEAPKNESFFAKNTVGREVELILDMNKE